MKEICFELFVVGVILPFFFFAINDAIKFEWKIERFLNVYKWMLYIVYLLIIVICKIMTKVMIQWKYIHA